MAKYYLLHFIILWYIWFIYLGYDYWTDLKVWMIIIILIPSSRTIYNIQSNTYPICFGFRLSLGILVASTLHLYRVCIIIIIPVLSSLTIYNITTDTNLKCFRCRLGLRTLRIYPRYKILRMYTFIFII